MFMKEAKSGRATADGVPPGPHARVCPVSAVYWLLLAIMLPGYVILTQPVKTWFYPRFGD